LVFLLRRGLDKGAAGGIIPMTVGTGMPQEDEMSRVASEVGWAAGNCVELVLGGAKRATRFLAPDLVVKATGRFAHRNGRRSIDMVVTVGKPNYAERGFVRACKKASEPFPIKNVQLKEWKR
jgi:hypothetical protein